MSIDFEWTGIIPGTVVKAEVNDKGDGWWQTFLTNNETGKFSGVHSMFLPGIPLTHEQAARIALEVWTAKGLDT